MKFLATPLIYAKNIARTISGRTILGRPLNCKLKGRPMARASLPGVCLSVCNKCIVANR